ncbi:MAG TPA: hypothetical protein VK638_59100 [Edaphobacter sp.]|nr:hypothetical protein [Edaphobacter sp.]
MSAPQGEPDWRKVYGHAALENVRLQAALRAAREERDLLSSLAKNNLRNFQQSETELQAEREARKQAEVEQFNAGVDAAAKAAMADLDEIPGVLAAAHERCDFGISEGCARRILERIRRLSKPVKEPAERIEDNRQ